MYRLVSVDMASIENIIIFDSLFFFTCDCIIFFLLEGDESEPDLPVKGDGEREREREGADSAVGAAGGAAPVENPTIGSLATMFMLITVVHTSLE